MNKKNREDLLRLAKYLELLPPSADFQFHKFTCGTAACALGWGHRAGLLPEGLVIYETKNLIGDPGTGDARYVKDGEQLDSNFGAVAMAYGISPDQASDLFAPDDCDVNWNADTCKVTAKQVANRIRRFLRAKSPARRKAVRA